MPRQRPVSETSTPILVHDVHDAAGDDHANRPSEAGQHGLTFRRLAVRFDGQSGPTVHLPGHQRSGGAFERRAADAQVGDAGDVRIAGREWPAASR